MAPAQYMRYIEEGGVWVSRIFFTSNTKQTLGSNFLQGKSVLFDVEHERMGFAESSCSLDRVASKDSEQNSRHAKKSFRDSMTEEIHAMSSLLRRETTARSVVVAGIIGLVAMAFILLCLRSRKHGRQQAAEDVRTNEESQHLLTLTEREGANGHYRYSG